MSKNTPWADWVERDDRSWVKSLSQKHQDLNFQRASLQPLTESIVTSLERGRQSGPLNQDLIDKFLTWFLTHEDWSSLKARWSEGESDGPWSLPIALSRSWHRFKKMNEGGPRSKKGQSDAQLENVANEVWKQFENSLSELPSDCRQIYSLYLEGLVPVEISHLLDVSISEVESQITQAKSIVTEDLKTTRKAS